MMKSIESTGKNEFAAITAALEELGLERDEVSVEILERAKSGFLGFGASPARVRVSYEVPEEVAPKIAPKVASVIAPEESQYAVMKAEQPSVKEKPPVKPEPKAEELPASEVEVPLVQETEEFSTDTGIAEGKNEDVETATKSFLSGLLTHMNVTATIQIDKRPEGGYLVVLEGEKLGALIGHRGETLDAIQQLTNYAVNRTRARRVRIHLDVENYRAKREEALKRLAEKVAGKAVKYRRNVTLEPMNAYERHVIHETLQDYADIITYSTGTEPNRRTVVSYSKGKHTY